MEPIILTLLIIIIGLLTFLLFRQQQKSAARISALEQDKVRLEGSLAHAQQDAGEKLKVYANAEERLKREFENLANRIFEDKGKALTAENRERLDGVLRPFKDQLESFRRRVDEIHTQETEKTQNLLTEVQNLSRLSTQVRADAENLARAIKGNSKVQGNWGELIVERIFEASGLRKGEEFSSQKAMWTEDGTLYKPDFLVHLPDNKAIIVDSKVSLTAYERSCSEEDESARETALREHILSVRNHVKELQQKDYTDLLGNRSLDFVIMCIPMEPAYQTALQQDEKLLYDLSSMRVVITGPTTLMITLKLITQIWRREHENQNAERIAEDAGKMHRQVALIVDAMLESQKKLAGVSESFDTAMKRLKTGKGSLVGRIEKIRQLGAKVSRTIPAEVVNEALEGDEENRA